MSLQEDIEKEYDVYVYLPDDLPDIINKVLDAAVEAMKIDAKELGIDEDAIHYLQTGINKLRGE